MQNVLKTMNKPRKVKIKYKNKVYTYFYPNHTKRQVLEWKITTFFKSYWLLIIIVLGLSAGIWLHVQMNKQVCGLQAVQCIGE